MGLRNVLFLIANKLPTEILNRIRSLRLESSLYYLRFRLTGKVPLPESIIIDPANICNLKCPLCPTGSGKLNQEKGFLSLKFYKKILEQIPSIKRVSLFNWGEPFLNPEILEILKYTSSKGIFSTIHSNFCIKKGKSFFNELVKTGLNRISISLDGASQETFSKYRVGGDFDLVYKNMVSLIQARKENKSIYPRISWQFIVNRYNEHELEKAALMAKELGILFAPVKMDMNERHPDFVSGGDLTGLKKQWLPANQDFIEERYKDKQSKPHSDLYCEFLFSQPVITPDGNVYPCCLLTNEMNAYGNINYESFEDIWKNEIFKSARNLFRKGKNSSSSIDTICHHCQCGCGEENSSTSRGS